MLSTEAPPPDLPCPCVISQQNSGSSNILSIDERVSDNNQQQLEVDLFKSDLDDNNNPLPKFSIRDYVSCARGKDIKTNWPFSQKNLQLCLKHGVTDVLPPFQPLDIVRNPSRMKCVDVKLPALSDRSLSSGFQEGKEFESTTLPSCSNINSVPLIKAPCSKPEVVSFPRPSVEKPESSAPASRKVEKSTQNSAKNCKLIVKLNKIAEPLSIEHSETMASKVCPVCKTFSSSSNTTLNAHIDQCLSGVSTMDWTSNSKVSKHRIKPRKTRLMVDIYETALRCTLEDLDRRNGTNWASNKVSSTQDLEAGPKERKKKKRIDSSSNVEGNEEGAVYVDSSGTKFLSLSKCSELPFNSNAKDDCGTRKLVVMNKESNFLLRKKRKVLVKRHKSLQRSHYGRASSSPGPSHCPEVNKVQQKKLFHEGGYEEEYTTQPVKAYDQMKYGETGMMKQWVVGSKLTGFRKISHENEHQHSDKTVKNLIVKDGHSSLGDSFIKGTCDSNSLVFSDENPLLPSEYRKRKENLQYAYHDEHIKQPYLRKRDGLSVMTSQDCHSKSNRLTLHKCVTKQSRKYSSLLLHKRHTGPLSGTENLGFSGSNKRDEINTSTGLNAECSFSDSRMSHHHAFSYGGKDSAYSRQPPLDHVISPGHNKKSTLRKKPSVSQASAPESKDNSGNRHLNFNKPRLHYTSDSDDEAVVPQYAICRRDNQVEKLIVNAAQMENTSVRSSMEPARVLKIRKEGIFLTSSKEVDMASMGSEISPELDSHNVRKNIDFFIGGGVPASTSNVLNAVKEAEIQDESVCELISERADGAAAFLAFSKSLDSSFYELAGPSNVKIVSQGYVETYKKYCPTELFLGGESEMFYADKVGRSMTSSHTGLVGKMDANGGQGNYFVDVDPIPIPGPPGSFLPSPGRMSSEELQGNSSLTTCRIQSSEDKHELMDVDSSDSPISSESMVSEPVSGRSDSVSARNLSELSEGIQDHSRCNISEDRVVETSKLSALASHVEGEPGLVESRADLMLIETNPHILNNSQPCCSRKGVFLKDSFNCQRSQILQRRSIASLALHSQEKHTGGDQSEMALNSNVMSQTPQGKVQVPGAENHMSNSQMGYAPILVSQNYENKFPTCGDCESPSPSTTNPVLRLMGKNLMVVNKEETLSPQVTQTHLSMARDSHPSMLSIVDNEITTVRFPNEYYSIHQTLSQVPSRYDRMQPSMLAQHLDASSSNCFENTAKMRIQESTLHPSALLFSSKSFGGSLASSLEHQDFASGSIVTSEFGSSIGPDTPMAYGVEKVQTHGHQLIRSTDFSGSRSKETLVISESPKREPELAVRATHGREKIEARRSPVGISAPVVFGHDSRHVNPAFYNNQMWGYPVCSGSQAFYAANIQVPSSMGILKANSVQWNCTREGSAMLHPNSLTASSPATGHPRSSLYFSPGFS